MAPDKWGPGVQIPTIVFTGDDPNDVSGHYADVNVVAYLRKPLESHVLLVAIRQALGCKTRIQEGIDGDGR